MHSYMRAINSFLVWACAQGEGGTARGRLPSVRERVLDTLSREEVQRLEDAAATERDKLIFRVLADTGIRLGELLALRPDDVRLEGGKTGRFDHQAWCPGNDRDCFMPRCRPPPAPGVLTARRGRVEKGLRGPGGVALVAWLAKPSAPSTFPCAIPTQRSADTPAPNTLRVPGPGRLPSW